MNALKKWIAVLLPAAMVACFLTGVALAEDATPTDTELERQQEFLKAQFRKLTESMAKAADQLEESDPASARAIRAALDQAGRALIKQDMAKVIEYLKAARLTMAKVTQTEVVEELEKVLATLQRGQAQPMDAAQLAKMKQFLEAVKGLKKQEQEHQKDARLAAEGKQFAERMQELMNKLKGLVERQEKMLKQTRQLPGRSQAVEKLARTRDEIRKLIAAQTDLKGRTAAATLGQLLVAEVDQGELKKRTDAVTAKLGQLGSDPNVAAALAAAADSGSKDSGSEGAGSKGSANAAKAAAAHAGNAAGEMGKAGKRLAATDAGGAGPHQTQAIQDLTKAEEALTKALKDLGQSTGSGKLAGDQKGLSKETSELASAVKQATAAAKAMGAGSQGGQQGGKQGGQQGGKQGGQQGGKQGGQQGGKQGGQQGGQQGGKQGGQKGGQKGDNLDRASKHMDQAADKLGEQDTKRAAGAEEDALREMRGELLRLAQLRRRVLEKARKADLAEQKKRQDDTADKTDRLAEKMKDAAKGDKKTPGQEKVSSAGESMKQASKQLGGGKPGSASDSQGKASEKLDEAEKELAEAIDKAQEEQQQQALVKIENMLRKALEAQQAITKETAEVHGKRGREFDRPLLLRLAKLSDGEGSLAQDVGKVEKMVNDEGTTAIFPVILGETRSDLSNVQRLLAGKQAGPLTQSVQKEVERNLKDMIDALQKEMRRRRQEKKKGGGGGGGGGGGKKPPLVPPVAELKMLRTLQKQIYIRTLTLDAQKRSGEVVDSEMKVQHDIAAERQATVEKMTTNLAKKLK